MDILHMIVLVEIFLMLLTLMKSKLTSLMNYNLQIVQNLILKKSGLNTSGKIKFKLIQISEISKSMLLILQMP